MDGSIRHECFYDDIYSPAPHLIYFLSGRISIPPLGVWRKAANTWK